MKDRIAPTRKPTFLREWRKHLGLSQETAAHRLGIKQGTLSKIERGELPYNQDFLDQAALAYGCDPEDFLNNNPLRPDPPRLIYAKVRSATREKQEEILRVVEAILKAS